jgi:hypothetical protein
MSGSAENFNTKEIEMLLKNKNAVIYGAIVKQPDAPDVVTGRREDL